jgi:hypothetical protein
MPTVSFPAKKFRLLAAWAAVGLFSIAGPPARALDPSQPPCVNFAPLKNAFVVQWPTCVNGVQSSGSLCSAPANFFYTDNASNDPNPSNWGAMVFACCDSCGCASSTNTPFRRVELAQISLSTGSGFWYITDPAEYRMTGTCKILQDPPNGSLIFAQIHGTKPSHGSELLKVWHLGGSIVCSTKTRVGGTEVFHPIVRAALGDRIDYVIEVNHFVVTATFSVNGGTAHTFSFTPDNSWNRDPLYFKAGNYTQDNGDPGTSKVAYFALALGTGPQK